MVGSKDNELRLRIAVIAFADVANYSRRIREDLEGTVHAWTTLRQQVIYPTVATASGRVINEAGDAALIEFPSVRTAINWALDVQRSMRGKRKSHAGMRLRISINVDDVLDDGETIQSDGVVVTSRIHQLAAPGSVVVTQSVRDIIRTQPGLTFRGLGAPQLKNIDFPIRVYAVEEQADKRGLVRPHANWSTRPTLAVLPFEVSGDDNQRYFGEGITEDIITGVSRSRAMFVVARNSTLQFSKGDKNSKEIASALGVKYLLNGSIRRQGAVLRINTELVDVDRDRAIWRERFDGVSEDIFSFQDQIVSSIVATLEPKVLNAETSNLGTRATENLDAYDCVLRALSELYLANGESYLRARDYLSQAVQLDPGYAQAHAYLAWCLNFIMAEGASKNIADDRNLAIQCARQALNLDPEDALNLAVRAHILGLHEQSPKDAVELLDEALQLNENLPVAWGLSATNLAYLGNCEEARDRLLNVWRLTPYDPLNFFYQTAAGLIEFVAGDYEQAITQLKRANRRKPNFVAGLRLLAASLGNNGNLAEAREVAQKLIEQDPGFSVRDFVAWYPIQAPAALEQLEQGLIAAGLPPAHVREGC